MSFTFRHTHPGRVATKSCPPAWRAWRAGDFRGHDLILARGSRKLASTLALTGRLGLSQVIFLQWAGLYSCCNKATKRPLNVQSLVDVCGDTWQSGILLSRRQYYFEGMYAPTVSTFLILTSSSADHSSADIITI